MAKIASMPSEAVINGFRGVLDYYVCRGINCVRKWPRYTTQTDSPNVQANWPIFTEASRLWNTLDPSVQAAYNAMASGSTLSGRDMMVKMYINAKSILPY